MEGRLGERWAVTFLDGWPYVLRRAWSSRREWL
jgi:hypothetical protein